MGCEGDALADFDQNWGREYVPLEVGLKSPEGG